jgi:hypothetical protein
MKLFISGGYDYKVYKLEEDGSYSDVATDVFSYTATMDDLESTQYTKYIMAIKADVKAFDFTYFKMEVTPSTETKQPEASRDDGMRVIENEFFSLAAAGVNDDDSTRLLYFDKRRGEQTEMSLSMKYYNPATGDDGYSNSDNDPSGAYIFKPMRDDQSKHAYSEFSHVESWTGENSGISIMTVYYTDPLKK